MSGSQELIAIEHELAALLEKAIGDRVIRYVLVLAIPSREDTDLRHAGPEDLISAACGNATPLLTGMLLADALTKTQLLPQLRVDVPK